MKTQLLQQLFSYGIGTLMLLLISPANLSAGDQPPAGESPAELDQPPIEDKEDATWGEDSARAVECHSLYRSHIRNDDPEKALQHWRCNYELAPKSTLHIYVDGVQIMRHMIDQSETEEEEQAYLDTLMQVYDDRIEHFGNEGFVLGRKGVDLLRHDRSQIPESFEIMNESIEIRGKESEYSLMHPYVVTLTRIYDAEMLEEEEFVGKFRNVIDIIQYNLEEVRAEDDYDEEDKWLRARERVKNSSLGYVSCEELPKIYEPLIAEYPENEDLLSHTVGFMDEKGCTDEEFYVNTAEKLYEYQPDAEIANVLAEYYQDKEDFDKAMEFFEDAIEMEDDDHKIGRYQLSVANIMLDRENFATAKERAEKAIEARPDWGLPHLFLGNLYVQGAQTCATEDYQERLVYVLAVDKYNEAKEIDEGVTDQANDLIETYSEHFPQNEDIFFHGLEEGEPYTFDCWINETTTIRTQES